MSRRGDLPFSESTTTRTEGHFRKVRGVFVPNSWMTEGSVPILDPYVVSDLFQAREDLSSRVIATV